MDNVISKISKIESAAASVMDNANIRKKEFAKEMEARISKFDSELEAETEKQINSLNSKIDIDMKAKLSKQRADAEELLNALNQNYNDNHEKYVTNLFLAMTEE